ncbi:MAG: hypothetical protein D6B27_04945, partial [Gammaproteobacteria bacterium]
MRICSQINKPSYVNIHITLIINIYKTVFMGDIKMKNIFKAAIIIFISFATYSIQAYECRDAVVLVHGNTTSPSSWDNTYEKLLDMGYDESEIFLPDWGSKWCASCNNHYG